MELIADRYQWQPAAPASGRVLNPARDTLSGAVVSVLQMPVPNDAAECARDVRRLRRYARVWHPHLAEVRAVEARAGVIRVVCEPLVGTPLESRDSGLTVRTLQRLAADVLEALAALHQAGITHGAVSARSLLLPHPTGTTTDLGVTVLPVPLLPDPADAGSQVRSPIAHAQRGDTSPGDDVRAAATLLLGLVRGTRTSGMEEAVLAASLTRALERAAEVDASGTEDGAGAGEEAATADAPPEPPRRGPAAPGSPGPIDTPPSGPARPSVDILERVRRPEGPGRAPAIGPAGVVDRDQW